MNGRAVTPGDAEAGRAELRQPALTREAERMRRALGWRRKTIALRDATRLPADRTAFKDAGLS